MKTTRRSALVALVVLAAAVGAQAAPVAWRLDRSTKVGFVAHTKMFDVKGNFSRYTADARVDREDLTASSIKMTIDVASLDTGVDMRDEHLRDEDFLAVRRFPQATFTSTKVERTEKPDQLMVSGKLTIRGITKDVVVPVMIADEGEGLRAKGKITIDRFQYGVAYEGGMLLPKVANEVDVTFDVGVSPKKDQLAQAD